MMEEPSANFEGKDAALKADDTVYVNAERRQGSDDQMDAAIMPQLVEGKAYRIKRVDGNTVYIDDETLGTIPFHRDVFQK